MLERATPGSGATGVAAGMIAPVGEAIWGEEATHTLALASGELWPRFATELEDASGRPLGYRRCGALHLALDRDEAEELRRRHGLHRELDLAAEWLLPRDCRRLEPGLATAAGPGVHAADEAEVDPRRLIAALKAAAAAAGVELVAGAEVVGRGDLRARAARRRSYSGRVAITVPGRLCSPPAAGWRCRGCRRRRGRRCGRWAVLTLGGPSRERVCERIVLTQWVYLVPREDGRVVVGATVEERGFDTRVTAGGVHELLREAYRVLPEIAELELRDASAGLRPGTPDNLPLIGEGGVEGLVLATGHWRHGIMLAPVTADAVAALVAGEDPPLSLDAVAPMRFEARVEVSSA